jgi:ClpP class serine protease
MIEWLQHATLVLKSLVSFGWEALLCLIVLGLILAVTRNTIFRNKKKKTGPKFGMLQVNRGVVYDRKPALDKRRTLGLNTTDEADSAPLGTVNKTPNVGTPNLGKPESGPPAEVDYSGDTAVGAEADVKTVAPVPHDSCSSCAGETTDVEALYKAALASPKPVAVIKVSNDAMANGRVLFAKLVDEVIANRERFSRVVVIANSPGGGASQYGHMLYEMTRLRRCSGLHITAVVDVVAASGGMLQILPAHLIVAAPWAIIGSIGVVTEFLNFNGLLEALGITPVEVTAGKFKRTLTMYGKVDDVKKGHMEAQLAAIHRQFIAAVKQFRPTVDEDKVCNGDHWTAQEVFDQKLGLVDRLGSSQELLFEVNQHHDLIILEENANPWEKGVFRFLTKLVDYTIYRLTAGPFGRAD